MRNKLLSGDILLTWQGREKLAIESCEEANQIGGLCVKILVLYNAVMKRYVKDKNRREKRQSDCIKQITKDLGCGKSSEVKRADTK